MESISDSAVPPAFLGARPELELLLACARGAVLRQRPERLSELLSRGLDWPLVLNLAQAHALTPALYRGVIAAPETPRTVARDLKLRAEVGAMRVGYLVRELLSVIERFKAAGIAAIPFKGPLLSWLAYGDAAMREFVDCDILVHGKDVPRAAEILAGAGYVARTFDPARFASGFFRDGADEFAAPGRLVLIDLHWKIMAWYFPFAPAERELWARARSIEFNGAALTSLAPEDLMLVLAVHAAKHGWCSIGQVAEIAGLLHFGGPIGWAAMLKEAERMRSRRMLLLAAWLANEMFAAPVAQAVRGAAAADTEVMALGAQILWRLSSSSALTPGVFHKWIVPLRTIERSRDRARFFLDLALSPTGGDGALIALPRALYPLYYALRPMRLLARRSRALASAAGAALMAGPGAQR